MNKKILIIGLIWPEPEATAAGTRMMQLISIFLKHEYKLYFASAAARSDLSYNFEALDINCFSIELNNSNFDVQIKDIDPGIVLFDRFLTEEQYGWRIQEACPDALRILDTEDLHFLRKSREIASKKNSNDWLNYIQNDITKREVASIFRCDMSLVISEFEVSLLEKYFHISPSLLFYIPLLVDSNEISKLTELPDFEQRKHFMSIGNFKHQPNLDAVRHLRQNIWPAIRKQLPQSEMHVYGAYLTEAAKQLESKKEGFYIKGWISDKSNAFTPYKVCLAPLRFGAGQKGKLLDAMYFGTPSVTTSIGAEGISETKYWNGFVTDNDQEFANKAVLLYSDDVLWMNAQKAGEKILKTKFDKKLFEKKILFAIENLRLGLDEHRTNNFIGSMLSHHSLQSTKYMSKWIESKNLSNDKII